MPRLPPYAPAPSAGRRSPTTTSYLPDRPADFVSVHAYANAPAQLAAARRAMGDHRRPLWLTEYASYTTDVLPTSSRGHAAAAAFFADVKRLLAEPGLDRVYLAQWVDESMGIVDERLHRRALFNALAAYQTLLPTTRRPARADGVDAMAAADGSTAAVAVWNPTDAAVDVTVTLDHAPPGGTARAYVIDGHHASHGDDPTADERLTAGDPRPVVGGRVTWTGRLAGRSVVVVRATVGR